MVIYYHGYDFYVKSPCGYPLMDPRAGRAGSKLISSRQKATVKLFIDRTTMRSHRPKGTLDYSRITPKIYIGTNQCCRTHFAKELLKKGVRADISLEAGRLDAPFGVEYYLWLPTRDHTSPSQKQLAVGVAFLSLMASLGEKVYVHCKNGHGRAPTLVAAYLTSKGMTPGEALRFIKKRRRVIHLRGNQKKNLKIFYEKLRLAEPTQQLAKLFKKAEMAHAEYEKSIGHKNENWPKWYAEYTAKRLNN